MTCDTRHPFVSATAFMNFCESFGHMSQMTHQERPKAAKGQTCAKRAAPTPPLAAPAAPLTTPLALSCPFLPPPLLYRSCSCGGAGVIRALLLPPPPSCCFGVWCSQVTDRGAVAGVSLQWRASCYASLPSRGVDVALLVSRDLQNDDVFHQACWSGLLQRIPDGVQKGV